MAKAKSRYGKGGANGGGKNGGSGGAARGKNVRFMAGKNAAKSAMAFRKLNTSTNPQIPSGGGKK